MYDSSGNFFTDINYSPLALGGLTKGVTVLEMTAAYSVFPNDGVYYKPKTYLKVLDSSGNVILSNDDNAKIILSEETADIMTKMMENVVDYGTASKLTLRKKIDCAGKTGTTNDTKDLYYCGYTPYYTASVWFGYDRARDLGKFSTSPALDIWDKVMTQIHDPIIQEAKANGTKLKTFEMSPQIITCEYCLDSGMLAGENCNLDPRGKRVETGYFTRDTMPRKTCTVHIPVEFCTESGCVAGENCPETTTKALLDIDMRIFEKHVIITDSQYLYMPLPKNYVFPSSQYVPYYMNLYPLNTYSGLTNSSSKPLNRYCTLHNHELTDAVIDFERQPVQTEPTINQ